MKSRLRLALLLFVFPISATRAAESAPTRPNVILIVADDLGYGDLGSFGCKDIPTPNIDSIATDGVKFVRAYGYNVCSPTRAAILTGRYAERGGIRTVLMGSSVRAFAGATTLAKVLHDAGYATGLVGKWHLGYDGAVLPTRMGFDEFFGFLGGKIDYFKHTDSTQHGKHELWEGEKEVFRDGYSTELFTDRAVRFLGDHAKGPFYLQLAYNAPHYPTTRGVYQAPDAYLKKFGVTGSPDHTRAGYAAMVSCMDDGIGKVLGALRRLKLEKNTIVIFVSDNGGEDMASNGALAGGKHNNAEGGIRVPWVMSGPGIPKGAVRDDIFHAVDLMPTLLAATGTKAPEGLRFDGLDAWPALTGGTKLPERTLFFPPDTALAGRWKLRGDKLYDLENDPVEKHDVAAAHPDMAAALRAGVKAWRADVGLKEKAAKKPPAPATK